MSKLSPFKKDPKQKATIKVMTVADRLKQSAKPPKPVGAK